MKKNNAIDFEVITIRLDEVKHPIAFNNKVQELVEENGLSVEDAKNEVRQMKFDMEIYYEKNSGLFMVESDAVECSTIYSPYKGEAMEECDDNNM